LVRHLFASRRKTVKNNLHRFISSHIPKGAEDITLEALEQCRIQEHRRAETLGLEDFIALAETVAKLGTRGGTTIT
jgi:16S rRNA A1518/A1519 N6-dimethyltransferase RsmA/KsgA/DIM1 with predicted DNA glycosylase/AP lyase activity